MDEEGYSICAVAIAAGNVKCAEVVESLFKAGVDPHWTDPTGRTYLHSTALYPGEEWSTHVALAELLLAWGAPLGERKQLGRKQREVEGVPLSRSEEARGISLLAIGRSGKAGKVGITKGLPRVETVIEVS